MKKFLLPFMLVFAAAIAFFTISTSAATDGIYSYSVSNGEATITGCDASISGTITIPSTLGGYPVTSIGEYAFSGCDSLASITIPDSVTSIDKYAFSYCYRLSSITIPDSVTSIGEWAFSDCDSLTSITIPDSVTSIGDGAFGGCDRLASITIPDSVTSIGEYAFGGCSSLASISIPNSVTSISYTAFHNCSSLASITIPDSVTSIGGSAFARCSSLSSIAIPDSVTSIGESAFYGCSSLTSITMGKGCDYIPQNAFYDCKNLKSICLPAELKYIRKDAFSGCSNINTIFYAGDSAQWDAVLKYAGNDTLTSAKVVYNAAKKTYKFVTNCAAALPDVTDYAIFTSPAVTNGDATLSGWYDNPSLTGTPVIFPYYGEATTLYAAWTDRTGKSFDDAFIVRSNSEHTVTTTENGQLIYFKFVPKVTKEYRFYSTGSKDTDGYLYNSNKSQLASNDDSGEGNNFYISYNLTAGETYYIAAKLYSGSGTFTVVIEEPVDYRLNSITLKDMSGNALNAIPTGNFLATISFTNISSKKDTVIVLAQYSASGVVKGLMYVSTKDVPTGSTLEISLPVDNTNGEVVNLKAFCWESLGSMIPLGNTVSFLPE